MFANLIKLAGYLQSVKPQTSLTVTAEQAQLSPEQFDALVRQWAHKLPADFELIDQRYARWAKSNLWMRSPSTANKRIGWVMTHHSKPSPETARLA